MSDCPGRWLSAYVDGELDGRRRDRVAAHLAGCADCRRAVAEERAAKSWLAGTLRPEPPAQLRDRLREPVDWPAMAPEPPPGRARRVVVLAGLATAGTAAVVVVVAAPGTPSPGSVTPPLTQFAQAHFGSTCGLPLGSPGLSVVPAAFATSPAP